MKKFLKYFSILAAASLIIGCGTAKKASTETEMCGTSMKVTEVILHATQHQVDSVCTADSLPKLKTWTGTSFTDFETRQVTVKRMHIRRDNGKETVYIIMGKQEPYTFEKRISE